MRFRAKIFLAVLVPSSVLVSGAAAAALYGINDAAEKAGRLGLDRTYDAFQGVLSDQLMQLKALSGPFNGTAFDAAITEAVASGDLALFKELVEIELERSKTYETTDLVDIRTLDGRILFQRSRVPGVRVDQVLSMQSWISARDSALTEFSGRPFLAIRIKHERGYLVFATDFTPYLERMVRHFGIHIALLQGNRALFSSLTGWSPAAGAEGTVRVGGIRYLAARGKPPVSELDGISLLYSMENVDEGKRKIMAVGAVGLAAAVLVASLISLSISGGISRPVEALVAATVKVGQGDYTVRVDVPGRDELGKLGRSFNDMTEGLRRRRDIMEKTLSRDVAEELMKGVELGGERREVTILFMDVRGFTSATEGVDPALVVAMINELMNFLAEAIDRHGGNVNKYLGDGLLAMFGAPRPLEQHALCAVRASLEMQQGMAEWNARRAGRGLPPLQIGIGINTGTALGGNVGSKNRLEYTLIGEEVNLASRVCGKASPGQILITKATHGHIGDRIRATELKPIQVKGLSYPVHVYEVQS